MRSAVHRLWANVRWILWAEWDPIGCGVPEDEYDNYVSPIVKQISRREGVEVIANYLDWAAGVNMGLSSVSRDHNLQIARKLADLGNSR